MARSRLRVAVVVGAASAALLIAMVPASAANSTTADETASIAATHRGVAPVVHSAPAAGGVPSDRDRAARRVPPFSTAGRGKGQAPAALPEPTAATRPLLTNIDAVSSRDSRNTNFNHEFEPPDPALCVGNGFVLEAVNSAYSIYSTAGARLRGPFNVNDLFNEGAAEFTTDPRCYYEASTHTWYATILFINAANTASRVDVAVNTSGDPRNSWTQYQFDTSDDGRLGEPSHPGCPCLGDQPLFGIDQQNVYLSTNEFPLVGAGFNSAQLYAVSKRDLQAAQPAHFVHFDNLSVGGTQAASVQPAVSSGNPGAEFFLSSLDPHGTFDNRLGVWAMTHRDAVGSGGSPVLSKVVLTSEPYGRPPMAQQKGSTSLIDAGDDRMMQAQFTGGTLWGALGTAITIPNDPVERAGAAWFAVHPILTGDTITGAVMARQGYVASRGQSLLYPALQADAAGRAAMVFTSVGASTFPSAAYAAVDARQVAFGSISVAAVGQTAYDAKATRWGDYSAAILDPAADAVWMATEYTPPLASQTPDRRRNWGTRVFEVSLS